MVGTQQSFKRGVLRTEVQPLTLSYNIFDREGTPFVFLIDKWYPFRTLHPF